MVAIAADIALQRLSHLVLLYPPSGDDAAQLAEQLLVIRLDCPVLTLEAFFLLF